MRGIRAHFSRDDGMTIVEVVIAAAILFFIATAVLGVLGRTVSMGAQAQQMNVSTNAVNSYVEWVRSLEFTDIDDGASIVTTTVVTEGYQVLIEPTVSPGENASLKNLEMQITVSWGSRPPVIYETMVVIRDRDQHLTSATRSPATDPRITFVSPTPPDGTAVWYDGGSWWEDSSGTTRPLNIAVKVVPTTGRTVQYVEILGHNAWPLADTFGELKQWIEPTWSVSPVFTWDLTQETILGEPLVQEGTREINAWVTDNTGAKGPDERTFVVDNFAPSAPPAPLTHVPAGSMAGALTWEVVPDGSDPSAFGYELELWKQISGTTEGTKVPGYSGPGTTLAVTADPMSHYAARARAYSIRGLSTAWTDWTAFVTRPRITGTYQVMKYTSKPYRWEVKVDLVATAPSFDTTGTTVYTWYENGTQIATTTTNTFSVPKLTVASAKTNPFEPFPVRTYSVAITTTPNVFQGGSPVTVTSDTVVTAEQPSGSTKYPFAEGTW